MVMSAQLIFFIAILRLLSPRRLFNHNNIIIFDMKDFPLLRDSPGMHRPV